MGTPFSRRRVGRSTPEALPESPRFNFTRDVVEANAAADRYRVALAAVAAEGVIDRRTFSEVAGEAARWAGLLRTRNLTPGDRAIVQLPASPGWCSAILGLLKAGFVVVPCSMHDDDEELLRRATDSGAQLIIARKEHVSHDVVGAFPVAVLVEQVAAELRAHAGRQPTEDTREDDAAFVFYTAGTTGDPLGAVHTHGSIRAAMAQANDWLKTGRDDVVSCVWDSGWPGAIWDLLGAWASGARIVVHERIRDLDVDERLEMLHRLGVRSCRRRLWSTPRSWRISAPHGSMSRRCGGFSRVAPVSIASSSSRSGRRPTSRSTTASGRQKASSSSRTRPRTRTRTDRSAFRSPAARSV